MANYRDDPEFIRVLEEGKLPTEDELRKKAINEGRIAGTNPGPSGRTLDELPGRRGIQVDCDRRKTAVEQFSHSRLTKLNVEQDRLTHRLADVEERHQEADAEAVGLAEQLAVARPDRGPSHIVYLLILALLGIAEFPTIDAALQTFPGSALTRLVLAVVLSFVLAVAAHLLSKFVRRLIDDWERRESNAAEFWLQVTVVAVSLIFIVALMITMALARGASFSAISELTDGAFSDPGISSKLMLAVQLVLFGIAMSAGLLHAEGAEARRLTRELRKAQEHADELQAEVTSLEQQQAELQRQIDDLPRERELWLQQEDGLKQSLIMEHDARFQEAKISASAARS